MFQSMFDRLLALFMVIILLLALINGAFSVLSVRKAMTESRMESLLAEARDIAYLANRIDESVFNYREAMSYLQWKARNVYNEYGAYILIVDHNGRVMDNMDVASQDGSEIFETLTTEELSSSLKQVMQGSEVRSTISRDKGGTIFTVAVPWEKDGKVTGAVFIHTRVQIIEATYHGLSLQLAIGFALAAIAAIIGAAFYTKSVVHPLTIMTQAAEEMSRGNFSTRAEITGANEVKQLAGAFNIMAEKLEKSEESRRDFVANVSHELRSPVTSIHGFVEGILDETIPQEEEKKYLQIVFDETNRMKRLIADLLQLSRMDKGVDKLSLTDFNLNELIRRVIIGRMADLEELQIEPQIDFCEEPCLVRADNDRITQVVHNIVDNALKYLHKGGTLTITTTAIDEHTLAVDIKNNGDPISPNDRDHVFERFYKAEKAHTSGKGTGLGLSICKQIMNMHGQELSVLDMTEGAGFRFTLRTTNRHELLRLESSSD